MLIVIGTPPCRCTCGLSFAPFRSKAKCTLPRSPRRARFRCEREKHSRIPRKEWTEATCLQSQHRPWPAFKQPAATGRFTAHPPFADKIKQFYRQPSPHFPQTSLRLPPCRRYCACRPLPSPRRAVCHRAPAPVSRHALRSRRRTTPNTLKRKRRPDRVWSGRREVWCRAQRLLLVVVAPNLAAVVPAAVAEFAGISRNAYSQMLFLGDLLSSPQIVPFCLRWLKLSSVSFDELTS